MNIHGREGESLGISFARFIVDPLRFDLLHVRVITEGCVACGKELTGDRVYCGHIHSPVCSGLPEKVLAGRCMGCYQRGLPEKIDGREDCPGCEGDLVEGMKLIIEIHGAKEFTVEKREES